MTKVLPYSQAYFLAGGSGSNNEASESSRFDMLSREIERLIFHKVALSSEQTARSFRLQTMIAASRNNEIIKAIRVTPLISQMPDEEFNLAMCAMRDRLQSLLFSEHTSSRARPFLAPFLSGAILASAVTVTLLYCASTTSPGIFSQLLGTHSEKIAMSSAEQARNTVEQILLSSLATQQPPAPQISHPKVSASTESTPPTGLLVYGKEDAPNRVDAWLSLACSNCPAVWANLRDNMGEVFNPDQVAVYVQLIVPGDSTYLTLSFYYEAILEQDPDLAKEFMTWAYDQQAQLRTKGLGDSDLEWLKGRLDFAKFRAALQGPALKDRLTARSTMANQQGLVGTPTLMINGNPLAGSEITPENIRQLLSMTTASPKDPTSADDN